MIVDDCCLPAGEILLSLSSVPDIGKSTCLMLHVSQSRGAQLECAKHSTGARLRSDVQSQHCTARIACGPLYSSSLVGCNPIMTGCGPVRHETPPSLI